MRLPPLHLVLGLFKCIKTMWDQMKWMRNLRMPSSWVSSRVAFGSSTSLDSMVWISRWRIQRSVWSSSCTFLTRSWLKRTRKIRIRYNDINFKTTNAYSCRVSYITTIAKTCDLCKAKKCAWLCRSCKWSCFYVWSCIWWRKLGSYGSQHHTTNATNSIWRSRCHVMRVCSDEYEKRWRKT